MGDNEWNQLGYDTAGGDSGALQRVPGLDAVSYINAARTHTCAIRADGSQWCWGTDPGLADGNAAMFSPTLSMTPQEIAIGL